MESLYTIIGKTRQAVYSASERKANKIKLESSLLELIRAWRRSHPEMGSRVMFHSLKAKGVDIPIGINAFEELMSSHNLTARTLKRFIPLTSDGKGLGNYKNLINGLEINNICQVIVTDITYFWLSGKWSHLFVVKDLYSQRLLGLYPSWDMKAESALSALNQALSFHDKKSFEKCIHHSDNGSQYNALIYRKTLEKNKMIISRAESCKQNGSCEQMNHIVKNMYLRHMAPQNMAELIKACKKVKRLMNKERAVEQLGYITVETFENKIAEMKPDSRPKKQLYDFTKNG